MTQPDPAPGPRHAPAYWYALGLGVNLGDRRAQLRAALDRLRAADLFGVSLRVSPLYETAPRDLTDQPPFLNQAICGLTSLAPTALLARLQGIERELGRDRGSGAVRFGPRLIDLDVLLAARDAPDGAPILLDTPDLTIPHPRLAERAFALVPLRDLAPDLRHPRLGQTIATLAARVHDQAVHRVAE